MDTQNLKKISDYEIAAFIFNSCKADARLDIISESPNENSHCIIKISSIENKKIKFAYNYGEGLILLQTAKPAKHCNILPV